MTNANLANECSVSPEHLNPLVCALAHVDEASRSYRDAPARPVSVAGSEVELPTAVPILPPGCDRPTRSWVHDRNFGIRVVGLGVKDVQHAVRTDIHGCGNLDSGLEPWERGRHREGIGRRGCRWACRRAGLRPEHHRKRGLAPSAKDVRLIVDLEDETTGDD